MKLSYGNKVLFLVVGFLLVFTSVNTASFASRLPEMALSVTPLDLRRTPTTQELMAAGQLGGQLFPTADIAVTAGDLPQAKLSNQVAVQEVLTRNQAINLSFGKAIQAWNKHEYKEAVGMFQKHIQQYPDSPWAAESALHIGCDARYSGRYTEATEQFNWIISKYSGNFHEGAKRLISKAKLRMANVKALQNNFPEAKKYFRDLIGESEDWRSRTYGSHWLQRLSRMGKDKLALLNCGMQALAVLLEQDGRKEEADAVRQMRASSLRGQNLEELQSIAAGYGYLLTGLRLAPEELAQFPLPAILQLTGDVQGDSGHYWILEQVNSNLLTLFDPQSSQRFTQTTEEFAREWDGIALVFSNGEDLPGGALSLAEMQSTYGGCCGVPRPESNLGSPGDNAPDEEPGCGQGAPVWSVNMVNLNLFVRDIPLWYTPAFGPSVRIAVNYNSQSATARHEPFGDKWQFNYGSYLTVDTGENVLIYMPDGRRDQYIPDGSGGYTKPYKIYNTLTKIAENHFELRFPDDTVYVYNIPSGTSSLQPFLVEIRDAYGQSLSFQYNADVQLTTITDAQGRKTTLTYNAERRVTQVTDPFGRTALFEYDDNCNADRCTLVKITDMGGYWSSLSYDEDVYLTEIAGDLGAWQFYIEPTDAGWTGDYPAPGGVMWENYRITITDPQGGKEEYYYIGSEKDYPHSWYISPRDYITWQSKDINNFSLGIPKTQYNFTDTVGERGEISSIQYPEGNTITYTYDPSTGERTSVSDSAGNTIQYTYNDMGRVTSITDAKGSKTDFTYAANQIDLTQINNGLGTVSMTYNAQHDILSITDRLNTTTAFTYNNKGQRTSVTEAQGVLDRVTNYTYDPATTKLIQILQGSNALASYTYDPVGRVKTSTDATGLTLSYDYNDLNYLTRIDYPDGKFSEKTYGSCCPGMITSTTDRSGKTTTYFYDELKRRVKTLHPDKTVTRAEYDANGNLITLLDSNSNPTRFSYDLNDRLVKKIYADGKAEEFVYNNLGQLAQQINGRGIAANYAYDANYNLLSVAYSDDTPGVTYQYDAYNRLMQQEDGIGLTKYSYDANSRLLSLDGPWDNDTLSYQYDMLGRRTGVTPQSGSAISYSYDNLNRLTQIQSNSRNYTYAYNGINPLVQNLTRPNGSRTAYLYDSLNRLTSLSNRTSADAILTQHIFTYNGQDLRGSEDITRSASAASPAEQLTTYQYNALNQLLEKADPAKAFVYDDDGNMTQGYTPDGYSMNAAYDAENRLTQTEFTDAASVIHRARYYYGADNLLRKKQVYANGALAAESRYVLDGFNVLQERDSNNTVLREYTWGLNRGGGIGGLLNLRQGGQNYSYLYDGKGNVDGLIDDAEAMVASYVYSAFGHLLTKTGTVDQPFRFSTKAFDEQTGLAYYGYRFYSPGVGRWINRDPIGEAGGINLYGFVGNGPVNWVDPFGLYTLNDARNSLKNRGAPYGRRGLSGKGYYTDTQIFDEWLDLERNDTEWLNELPACPKKINTSCENPDEDTWNDLGSANIEHPGATYEMRSHPTSGGHASQCTYDNNGNLMTSIPAGGTADRGAWSLGTMTRHAREDLGPWGLAKKLNRRKDYYEVRPVR